MLNKIKNYLITRKKYGNFHNEGETAERLYYKITEMNGAKIFKPSYKEVEEFISRLEKVKYTYQKLEVNGLENPSKQWAELHKEIQNMPLNTLTDCENYLKEQINIYKKINKNTPSSFKKGVANLLMGETIILAFIIISFLIVINFM